MAGRPPRLRVRAEPRKRWYGTLYRMDEAKREFEMAPFLHLRDLPSPGVDLVLFDLISTDLAGHGSPAVRNAWLQRTGLRHWP